MKCGIVGPPLSGKTTLFNILTGQNRVDPMMVKRETHRSIAQLSDSRVNELASIWNSKKIVFATVEYVDIPGISLDKNSKQPYPARYLSDLRSVDMLALVIRDFINPVIPHHSNSIDPVRDLSDALLEFMINDLDVIEKKLGKLSKMHDDDSKREETLLKKCHEMLSKDRPLRDMELSMQDLVRIRGYSFLSLKPVLVAINLGEENAMDSNLRIEEIKAQIDHPGDKCEWVSFAGGIEAEIAELEPEDRPPFLEELGYSLPVVDRIVKSTFNLLGMITFLTAGEKETRAWSLRSGSNAKQAARVIHEDIARGFIRAEVYDWKELIEAGSEFQLKKNGRIRLEGKNYIIKDGDALNIRFNI